MPVVHLSANEKAQDAGAAAPASKGRKDVHRAAYHVPGQRLSDCDFIAWH